MRLRV